MTTPGTTTARTLGTTKRWRTYLVVASVLLGCGACEAAASWLYHTGWLDPFVVRVYEKTDPMGHFHRDRALGYRLSPAPARVTMLASDGQVLSRGLLRGNNFGLADLHDFKLKGDDTERRYAVLGDSMTAGRFIDRNWPESAEPRLAKRSAVPIRLYNMGIDGGGLGNWAHIVENFIAAQDMQLEGVIFAVATDDLDRPFVWWDDTVHLAGSDPGSVAIHYDTTWDLHVDSFAGQAFVGSWMGVTREHYDALLRGEWQPDLPRRPLQPYLASRLWRVLANVWVSTAHASTPPPTTPREAALRKELLAGLRRTLHDRHLAALVLGLPGTDLERARAFAAAIGADYRDGGEGSERDGYDEELKIKIDRHWNQAGSDHFAAAAAEHIETWLEAPRDPSRQPATAPR